jgi:hypothetical protein
MRITALTAAYLVALGYGLVAYGGPGRSFNIHGQSKYYVFEEYIWDLDSVVLRDHSRRHILTPYRYLSRGDQYFVDDQRGVVTRGEVHRGIEKRPNPTPKPRLNWQFKYNWKYPGEWKYRFR